MGSREVMGIERVEQKVAQCISGITEHPSMASSFNDPMRAVNKPERIEGLMQCD